MDVKEESLRESPPPKKKMGLCLYIINVLYQFDLIIKRTLNGANKNSRQCCLHLRNLPHKFQLYLLIMLTLFFQTEQKW